MARRSVPRAQNLIPYSSPSAWSVSNIGILSAADIGSGVTRIIEAVSGNSRHVWGQLVNPVSATPGEYIFQVDASSTNRWLAMVIEGAGTSTLYQYFDLATGAMGSSGSGGDGQMQIGAIAPSCILLPNGKRRCRTGVRVTKAGAATFEIAMATGNGATAYPVYVGDGVSYIDAVNATFAVGTPLDVHTTSGVADALSAAARSRVSQYENLHPYSETFASLTVYNTTFAVDRVGSLSNTTATTVTSAVTGGATSVGFGSAGTPPVLVSGQQYTMRWKMKYLSQRWVFIGANGGGVGCWFDLLNGAVGTQTLATLTAEAIGNGFYNLDLRWTQSGASSTLVLFASANGGVTLTGTGAEKIIVEHVHLVKGNHVTMDDRGYIATGATGLEG